MTPTAPLMVQGPVPLWCRDLVSCLHATVATVLLHAGEDALGALGAAFGFLYRPGEVRSEEFYFPCPDGDLVHGIAPHHPVRSSWWQPTDPEQPLRELLDELVGGRLVIAAVDNYHLPFRPAFHDVHAAHLLVVYGLDEARGRVHVSDAMPPAFQGPIALDDFLRSWGSGNPVDPRDAFFSDTPIAWRCLAIELDRPLPAVEPRWLAGVLGANLDGFAERGAYGSLVGLAGVEAYTAEVATRARAGEGRALEDLYVLGWGMQAQAALHAELLRRSGVDWQLPALLEASRKVDEVAHAWTGLRVTGAHGRRDPRGFAADLARHGRRLLSGYRDAVEWVAETVPAMT